MAIKTPDILPGEPGWTKLKEGKIKEKERKKIKTGSKKARIDKIGTVVLGDKGFRFGKPISTFKGDKKYPIWRYKRKIGELRVKNAGGDEKTELSFNRLGGIGNHKHLIQDADFQLRWMTREQELLLTQKECYLCKKKISRSSQPNLYHYNLFKKRTELLEEANKVPEEVVKGKLTLSEGWQKFNQIIENGNRYYMTLQETALICPECAKQKGMR